MKVHLLLGGAGFIGSHIASILEKKKDVKKIIIIDNFSRGSESNVKELKKNKKIQILNIDIVNFFKIKKYIKKSDVIYFLAAQRIIEVSSKPIISFNLMCKTYLDMMLFLSKLKLKKNIIFSSSASIYGQADKFPTLETYHTYKNDTLYGTYKVFGEGVNQSFGSDKINYVNLRYFNIIGPRMDVFGKYTEVVIRWFEEIYRNNTITVHGKGDTKIDFIDVRDVAKINIFFANKKKLSNESYNVCNNKSISLIELAKYIQKIVGVKKIKIIHTKERKVNKVKKRLGSNKKLKNLINHNKNIDIKKSLSDTYEFWKREKKLI